MLRVRKALVSSRIPERRMSCGFFYVTGIAGIKPSFRDLRLPPRRRSDFLSVPSSRVKIDIKIDPLKMGSIGRSETPVRNYHY